MALRFAVVAVGFALGACAALPVPSAADGQVGWVLEPRFACMGQRAGDEMGRD